MTRPTIQKRLGPAFGSVDLEHPNAQRRNILTVRFTDEEVQILNAMAEYLNMPISELIRRGCLPGYR